MARRKTSKVPKNDFEYDEGEIYEFTSETPIAGDCILLFSFDDDSDTIQTNTASTSNSDFQDNITNSIEIKNALNSTKDLFDNRRAPLPNGATPAIDGETPNIKRSYTLRSSTIRNINELKSIHPDLNVCINTIADIAIDYYHNHIVNEGGTQ